MSVQPDDEERLRHDRDDDLGMWQGMALAALLGMFLWFLVVALVLALLVD